MPQNFHFPPGGRQVQAVALGMTQNEHASSRQHARKIQIIEQLLGERRRTPAGVLLAVGRIGENQVELLAAGR